MSTTTSPVTHTDVVAVKRAVRKSVVFPGAVDIGRSKRIVPIRIAPKKLSGIKCSEEKLHFFKTVLLPENKLCQPIILRCYLLNKRRHFHEEIGYN